MRLMAALERRVVDADRFQLFPGHRSDGNLRLYHQIGYVFLREESVSPQERLVYREKTTPNAVGESPPTDD